MGSEIEDILHDMRYWSLAYEAVMNQGSRADTAKLKFLREIAKCKRKLADAEKRAEKYKRQKGLI